MDNSYFIFTENEPKLRIKRFHICIWEFHGSSSLVEFGAEISRELLERDTLSLSLFVPWFTEECGVMDLYDRLKVPENSRFIFNDSVRRTDSLDGGKNKLGVMHEFKDRGALCILPVSFNKEKEKIITITANLKPYNKIEQESKPNVYLRFWIEPQIPHISMRRKGISKSTVIYDVKVNERRNIPDRFIEYFSDKFFCEVQSCFLFNIIPNKYELVFFSDKELKNIRTLEFDSFSKYLGDKRVKKDELIVVFNKRQGSDAISFFSIYAAERIGTGQFAVAVLLNIFCGVLIFVPSYRSAAASEVTALTVWWQLPVEIYFALFIAFSFSMYFVWPWVLKSAKSLMNFLRRRG